MGRGVQQAAGGVCTGLILNEQLVMPFSLLITSTLKMLVTNNNNERNGKVENAALRFNWSIDETPKQVGVLEYGICIYRSVCVVLRRGVDVAVLCTVYSNLHFELTASAWHGK